MQTITVEELKARMDAGEKLNLIDCREPHEYAEFNIGATLIPLGKFQTFQIDELEHLKNEEVIIHCRSGNRSGMGVTILKQNGVTEVYNGGGLGDVQILLN